MSVLLNAINISDFNQLKTMEQILLKCILDFKNVVIYDICNFYYIDIL